MWKIQRRLHTRCFIWKIRVRCYRWGKQPIKCQQCQIGVRERQRRWKPANLMIIMKLFSTQMLPWITHKTPISQLKEEYFLQPESLWKILLLTDQVLTPIQSTTLTLLAPTFLKRKNRGTRVGFRAVSHLQRRRIIFNPSPPKQPRTIRRTPPSLPCLASKPKPDQSCWTHRLSIKLRLILERHRNSIWSTNKMVAGTTWWFHQLNHLLRDLVGSI